MAVLRAAGPFFLRDGFAWCARCRRTRMVRPDGARTYECPLCDRGVAEAAGPLELILAAGEALCGRCGTNAVMPTGPDGALECPGCDLPPWERAKLAQGVHVQETLDGGISAMVTDARRETPMRPAKPLDVVRGCFYCMQTTNHTWEWSLNKWRAKCTACGNRLQASRLKAGRATKRRGQQ